MIVDGESYSFVRASNTDVGVTLECWRNYDEGQQTTLVAEIVWYDATGKFVVRMPEGELPFVLVEALLREATRWCPPQLRDQAGTRTLIYVPLLDEGVDVWRPVIAERLAGDKYRIVGENIRPNDERWAYATGEVVDCEEHQFSDGSSGRVAVRRAG